MMSALPVAERLTGHTSDLVFHTAPSVEKIAAPAQQQAPASQQPIITKDSIHGHHIAGTPDTYKHGWNRIDSSTVTENDAYQRIPDAGNSGLTWQQQRAVREYTGGKYEQVNDYRRAGVDSRMIMQDKHQMPEHVMASDTARVISDTISNSPPVSVPVVLHRGVRDASDLFGTVDSMTGKTFTDHGFISTTTSSSIVSPFDKNGAVMHIYIPSGTKMLKPGDISMSPDEKEVLLDGLTGTIVNDTVIDGVRHLNIEGR